MIEFFVNSQRVMLPNDLSYTIIEENPVITKRGVFTFDITVSLLNKVNSKIFGHIQRRTNNVILSTASALLIAENKTYRGKIIDIKHTEESVSFQFVAGNSELNYIAKNETKIWKLDFGTETPDPNESSGISYSTAFNTINDPSWENKFVCAPVKIEGAADWSNKWELRTALTGFHIQYGEMFNTTSSNDFIIQPYLMYYINMLPSLLGYTLLENDLENDARAIMMYIPNSRRSFKYSDFLPDWTVGEFITYIEEFFNVIFIVDNKNNMLIKKLDDHITNADVVELTKVVDEFTREPEINPSQRFIAKNFTYNKTDKTGYFRYNKISDDILEKCSITNWTNLSTLISTINVSQKDKYIRNRSLASIREYIYSDAAAKNLLRYIPSNGTGLLNHVNKFCDYSTEEDKVELKIVPATMEYATISGYITNGNQYYETVTAPFQLPYVKKNTNVIDDNNLLESIEDNETSEYINRPSVMEVALFNCMTKLFTKAANWELNNIMYPYPFIDDVPEHGPIINADLSDFYNWISIYEEVCSKSLRLTGPGGIVSDYYNNKLIDNTYLYIYKVIADYFDINKIYIIENQKYIPVKAELEVSSQFSNKQITVYFYKLK